MRSILSTLFPEHNPFACAEVTLSFFIAHPLPSENFRVIVSSCRTISRCARKPSTDAPASAYNPSRSRSNSAALISQSAGSRARQRSRLNRHTSAVWSVVVIPALVLSCFRSPLCRFGMKRKRLANASLCVFVNKCEVQNCRGPDWEATKPFTELRPWNSAYTIMSKVAYSLTFSEDYSLLLSCRGRFRRLPGQHSSFWIRLLKKNEFRPKSLMQLALAAPLCASRSLLV